MLRMFDRIRSPEALGAWTSLHWFAEHDGEVPTDPMGRAWQPLTASVADSTMEIASSIASGDPFPPEEWWAGLGVVAAERVSPAEWAKRASSGYEQHYAHGVAVALGWTLGVIDDPRLMAPFRTGEGERLSFEVREQYRNILLALATGQTGPRAAAIALKQITTAPQPQA